VLGFVLLCLFLAFAVLLVGACNHELTPPPLPPGTGSGAGGSGVGRGTGGRSAGGGSAGDGFGGQGGNASCLGGDSCVQSCFVDFTGLWGTAYCDATGAFACPPNTVRLSTCPPNSCVQFTPTCCDDVTGVDAPAPCGPDGFKQGCPTGTHAHSAAAGCIPASLGVTNCFDLNYKPCSLEQQSCIQGAVVCSCGPTASDGGALIWQCVVLI
jgi:hypothetical protein